MFVYKITNNLNGKIYIGQHIPNNKRYFGSGPLIKTAIEKYGKDNFTKEILEECSDKGELNTCERKWIIKLDSTNPDKGYNLRLGIGDLSCFGKYNYKFNRDRAKNIMANQAKVLLKRK